MYSLIVFYVLAGKFNTNVDYIEQETATLELCQKAGTQVVDLIKKSNSDITANFECLKVRF